MARSKTGPFRLFGTVIRFPWIVLVRGIMGAASLAVQDVREALGEDSPGGQKVTKEERRMIALAFGARMTEILLAAWGIAVDLDGDGLDGDGEPIRRVGGTVGSLHTAAGVRLLVDPAERARRARPTGTPRRRPTRGGPAGRPDDDGAGPGGDPAAG